MATVRKRIWKSRGIERTAWVVDYFDQSGKRRLKTFDTKKAADAWKIAALHEVAQGTHTPASASITVAEAFERWIADCEANGLEFGTIKQRKEHLRLHVAPFLGGEKLSSLTMHRVHQFDADLRKNKRSLSMRRKVLTNMKTMLTFAQSQGLVAQNVARGVKIKDSERRAAGRMLRDGVNFPTRAELRTIMEQATGRWRPLIITAIFTGMRASELRGLLWKNVHLDEAVIHVRQRADAWGKLGNPKSKAGNRDIPLTPMVVNTLREWRSACPAGELRLVFPNTIGNVESQANVLSRFWHPLQVRAGMITEMGEPKYTFHSLRHAAASLFIAHLGWTPKRVQAIMGHASVTMTFDRYGHLFEDRVGDREAMKKLEAAIVAA